MTVIELISKLQALNNVYAEILVTEKRPNLEQSLEPVTEVVVDGNKVWIL